MHPSTSLVQGKLPGETEKYTQTKQNGRQLVFVSLIGSQGIKTSRRILFSFSGDVGYTHTDISP